MAKQDESSNGSRGALVDPPSRGSADACEGNRSNLRGDPADAWDADESGASEAVKRDDLGYFVAAATVHATRF